jgi:hypothetical protein
MVKKSNVWFDEQVNPLSLKRSVAYAAIIAFLAGCSSPQADVQVVARTLQTYQVGKTTMGDFIRDAHLVSATLPKPTPSYLDTEAFSPDVSGIVYEAAKGSPWMIYESSVNQTSTKTSSTFSGDNSTSTYTQKFVVGDIKKPICILSFDKDGKLTNIAPVPGKAGTF